MAYVTVAAGSTTSEDELVHWAAERVPEAAAAPKHIHLFDELPVTLVGKPYKPALRADAARREFADALAAEDGVVEVVSAVDDGSVVLAVTVDGTADVRRVEQIRAVRTADDGALHGEPDLGDGVVSAGPASEEADRGPRPVVIVGAGPTGVTAALLLARYGIPTVVLDRWADIYERPRAVHLDDEVHRILGRLGVDEEFAAISRPARGLRLVDRDLRVLAEFARDDAAGVHGYPQANMSTSPPWKVFSELGCTRRR